MATIKQLTEIISGRLTPSTKKLDSTLVDIKTGSKITSSAQGLDVDLSGLATSTDLNNKVDKVAGKSLSDTNFTQSEKDKLAGLEGSKFLGSYVSLTALNAAHATANAGNYADVDAGAGQNVVRYIWDVSDSAWVMQGAGGSLTAAQVKTLYESNPDTNALTDNEKAALGSLSNDLSGKINTADIADNLTTSSSSKVLSAKQGKTLQDTKADKTELSNYQSKATETANTSLSPAVVNSLPLYTLSNSGEYVLCEPDIWLKMGNFYVPAYSGATLGE